MPKKQKSANITPAIEVTKYIPKPSIKDEALKYLKQKGYYVFMDNGTIIGFFSTDAEYSACRKTLVEKYGRGNAIPFSFGGRIGDISKLKAEKKPTHNEETEEYSEEEQDAESEIYEE